MNATQILDATAPQQPVEATQQDDSIESNQQAQPELAKSEDPRLSLLAKMERKLKLQEQEYKNKFKELEEKQNKYKIYEELDGEIDKNPLALLEKKGWDIRKLNEHFLESAKDEDLDPVSKQFAEMKKEMEKLKAELTQTYEEKLSAKEKEIMQKDYEQQINGFKNEIKTMVLSNKDKYELINAEENGFDVVYDVIAADIERQKESGKQDHELVVMKIEEAADRVEKYLDSQVQKYLNLNKYRNKKSDEESSVENFFKKSQSPQTLTDSFTPKSKSVEELSEEERMLAAVNLLKSGKY